MYTYFNNINCENTKFVHKFRSLAQRWPTWEFVQLHRLLHPLCIYRARIHEWWRYKRERYGHRSSLRPYTAKLCPATRVGWFHLSQGIEVSIAAAMLHTRPLTTAPPCCIHFTSSPLSTVWTWILEAYSCPDGKRASTMSTIFLTDSFFLLSPSLATFLFTFSIIHLYIFTMNQSSKNITTSFRLLIIL